MTMKNIFIHVIDKLLSFFRGNSILRNSVLLGRVKIKIGALILLQTFKNRDTGLLPLRITLLRDWIQLRFVNLSAFWVVVIIISCCVQRDSAFGPPLVKVVLLFMLKGRIILGGPLRFLQKPWIFRISLEPFAFWNLHNFFNSQIFTFGQNKLLVILRLANQMVLNQRFSESLFLPFHHVRLRGAHLLPLCLFHHLIDLFVNINRLPALWRILTGTLHLLILRKQIFLDLFQRLKLILPTLFDKFWPALRVQLKLILHFLWQILQVFLVESVTKHFGLRNNWVRKRILRGVVHSEKSLPDPL